MVDVEEHYRQSVFIKEVCVIDAPSAQALTTEGLHVVVVPNLEVLRQRKIVNMSELIRFELENLSVALPAHQRVCRFDIVLEPLPRTATGELNRQEVLRLRSARGSGDRTGLEMAPMDAHMARLVAAVQTVVPAGIEVRPDSNLELDLGLDSMQRVELLAMLERRFGVRVPEAVAQSALLLSDLADALRGGAEASGDVNALPWAALLEAREPSDLLRGLLVPRGFGARVIFYTARVLGRILMRPEASGLEHVPKSGPFILAPNHQNYIDPWVIIPLMKYEVFHRTFVVGATEYFETRLMAWLAARARLVPVDPDANLVPAMQAAAFGLRHGKVLVLFPEGERSIDGSVKKFKKGAAILSHHLGVPIVPVAIDGLFEIWPRCRPLAWRLLLPWSGHRVRVRIGPPIQPDPVASYAHQTAKLREAVERMWLDIHAEEPAEAGPHD